MFLILMQAQATGRKMTVGLQEIQRLGAGGSVAQFMRQVQQGNASVTGVTQGATSRTSEYNNTHTGLQHSLLLILEQVFC